MEIEQALAYVAEQRSPGMLVTLFPDGRPQMSVVTAAVVEGRLWISTVRPSVKSKNVRNDPRVVFGMGVRPWVAIEGRATVQEGPDVLDRLRLYYRTAAGEHPDWDDYDTAMRRDQRFIIDIEPARAYGAGL